jgi:hypothetical protein
MDSRIRHKWSDFSQLAGILPFWEDPGQNGRIHLGSWPDGQGSGRSGQDLAQYRRNPAMVAGRPRIPA